MSFARPHRQLLADTRAIAADRKAGRAPSVPARLRAWVRQETIERRLLEGAEGAEGDAADLAVRAWQLTRSGARAQVARSLHGVLAELDEPLRRRRGASVPVCRAEVEVAREEIERVLVRLRDPKPLSAQGIVMLRRLLSDGDGPLYVVSGSDELWRRVRRASIALH